MVANLEFCITSGLVVLHDNRVPGVDVFCVCLMLALKVSQALVQLRLQALLDVLRRVCRCLQLFAEFVVSGVQLCIGLCYLADHVWSAKKAQEEIGEMTKTDKKF